MPKIETTGLISKHSVRTANFKLRVAVFSCVFFVCANLLLALTMQVYYPYHNARVGFGYRLPNKFVLIRKELPSVLDLMKKQMPSYQYNIILLGDSVTYGSGNMVTNEETIGRYLEDNLKLRLGSTVRVWNLAIPGSKPGDTYFMYKKALELKPDLLVINLNYAFFTPSNIKSPLSHKWLVALNDPDGTYRAPVQHLLNTNLEERLQYLAGDYLPIYKYREVINGLLFQDYPAKKLQTTMAALSSSIQQKLKAQLGKAPATVTSRVASAVKPGVTATAKSGAAAVTPGAKPHDPKKNEWFYLDWTTRLPSIAYMYNNTPLDPTTNVAYLFSKAITADLEQQQTPTVIFLAGQNHQLLQPLIDNRAYRDNMQKLDALLTGKQFSYLNFDGKIESNLFTDNVHLTAEGNQLVADYLTEPLIRRLKEDRQNK